MSLVPLSLQSLRRLTNEKTTTHRGRATSDNRANSQKRTTDSLDSGGGRYFATDDSSVAAAQNYQANLLGDRVTVRQGRERFTVRKEYLDECVIKGLFERAPLGPL